MTLEGSGERRGPPSAAVVTSDGATWTWPDLFDQFAPAIHSFARSRGVSNPDDIVQDVFAAAVERFPGFEGDVSGLRSFLFTVAYRRIADEHRNRYRRREQLVADHQPSTDDSLGIEDSYTTREDAAEAMRALDILGERERQIIEMRIIHEASPAEVARALGLSNGNVRVIQARALIKIRKYLETKSGSMPSIALVFAFARGFRTKLPNDGRFTAWMEMVQPKSPRVPARVAAAGTGSAIAAGSASTSGIAGTALKVGLVVVLTAASTSSVEANDPAGLHVPVEASSVVPLEAENEPAGFTVPPAVVDAPNPDAGIAFVAPNRLDFVPPSQSLEVDPVAKTGQAQSVVAEDSEAESTTGEGGNVEPIVGGRVQDVTDTVDDTVNTVVDTVDTVVDVVEPVVNTVIEVVEGTVDTVNDTVNNTVQTVPDVVEDMTDTVNNTVDTVTDAVNGALGGGGISGLLFP